MFDTVIGRVRKKLDCPEEMSLMERCDNLLAEVKEVREVNAELASVARAALHLATMPPLSREYYKGPSASELLDDFDRLKRKVNFYV